MSMRVLIARVKVQSSGCGSQILRPQTLTVRLWRRIALLDHRNTAFERDAYEQVITIFVCNIGEV